LASDGKTAAVIAQALAGIGCVATPNSVHCAMWANGINKRAAKPGNKRAREFMAEYQVSRRAVDLVGLDRLEQMADHARALMLHTFEREVCSRANILIEKARLRTMRPAPVVEIDITPARAERMLELMEKLARLRKMRKAA